MAKILFVYLVIKISKETLTFILNSQFNLQLSFPQHIQL